MKELRIGVVGTGAIGEMHIAKITNVLKNAKVVAVSDVNLVNAERVANLYGARLEPTCDDVVNAPDVDAIMVTAWDPAHKEFVMKSINVGKYVFCEKPLATTSAECKEIIEAEMKFGKKIVQVGYMRRYDKSYRELKKVIDDNRIGDPLVLHCAHRNVEGPVDINDDFVMSQMAIHEIDIIRWLIDDDYESVKVLTPKKTKFGKEKYTDPQIAILRSKTGVIANIECFFNSQFGYDIKCEVVGEKGCANLASPASVIIKQDCSQMTSICVDWKERFSEAYEIEIQEWINSVLEDKITGPSSWDGFVANEVADALNRSRYIDGFVHLDLPEKPEFYK